MSDSEIRDLVTKIGKDLGVTDTTAIEKVVESAINRKKDLLTASVEDGTLLTTTPRKPKEEKIGEDGVDDTVGGKSRKRKAKGRKGGKKTRKGGRKH